MKKRSEEIQNYIDRIMEQRAGQSSFDFEACQAVLETAAEMKSEAISGIGYYYFAEYYWNQGDDEKTMHCLSECTKCFRAEGMYEFLARSYNMMGAVSGAQDNQVVALNYFYTGLQYAEKYNLPYVQAMLDTNIGYILEGLRRYEEAAEKFEQAIRYFEQSEDSYHRILHIVNGMLRSGTCYLRLGKKEKAFELWDKVTAIKDGIPEKNYPRLHLTLYAAECEAAREDREGALAHIREILQYLQELEDLADIGGRLVEIAELVTGLRENEVTDQFFELVDAKGLESHPMVEMDLYPCRSRYLLEQEKTDEYLRCTRRYFSNYDRNRQNSLQVTARMVEMRDRMHTMERQQEKMRAANRRLESVALYDSMTNLANRTFLNEHASEKFEEAMREKKVLGVELMDIDYFKQYNDRYGHLAGDACIEAVAGVLRKVGGKRVFCGRYGGDEFMIVYSDMSPEEMRQVAEQIQDGVRALAIPHEGSECADIVTVSQGIFAWAPEGLNREWDYNVQADRLLYQAKNNGKNCYRLGTEFQA